MTMEARIGLPLNRVDGVKKVTGMARYAGEYHPDGMLYGFVVSARITRGRIRSLDDTAARAAPGVVEVITHLNRPDFASSDKAHQDDVAPPGHPFRPLLDAEIHYAAQPIALVVAETFEQARYAASLVTAEYDAQIHNTDLDVALADAFTPFRTRMGYQKPKSRGDADAAFAAAPITQEYEYRLAREHHNPMEPFASTVVWEGEGSGKGPLSGKLTIYDKTQGVLNSRQYVCGVFGLKERDVQVLSPFVGGAFGSGLRPQHQLFLAVMAALMLRRSVRVTLTRQQMFSLSFRPDCIQTVSLAADREGALHGIRNDAVTNTSRLENYMEVVVNWGGLVYRCDNAELSYRIAQVDTPTPGDMRAPGAATGMNLFEIAMDELAYEVGVDPLELRLRNYSDKEEMHNVPYTSKALRSAYLEGAERFGWKRRTQAPRSMREGRELVGWGMATGAWEAMFMKTAARAVLTADGALEVASATADIGTGTYTVMTQVAGDVLGVPAAAITARLGDTDLPQSPVQGGSWTAASVGAAVALACETIRDKLLKAARGLDGSPLANLGPEQVRFADGRMSSLADPSRSLSIAEVMRAAKLETLEAEEVAKPGLISQLTKARNTHCAVFAEVRVDEELGVIRVTRLVNAVAAGRIINPKTARSQVIGGMVFAMGMALTEEGMMDHTLGRVMNHSLAEYHIPVNADVPAMEVIFVDEPDQEVSPLGVKGLGEIGVVGAAAAIANAIFHATGKRVRELPITIDRLL